MGSNTLLQDVRFALRQLKQAPGFTATAVLTLALGIGANAAIFTLVNAVLLMKLPVADPATLVRIGDDNWCCVNTGARDDGDYTMFPTETYEQIRKNTPEFEDVAAMQAGYTYQPIIARREKTREAARSLVGEFVSGNYFRTFGLRPAAGRLFNDADDQVGAPVAAVMSYQAWKNDYAGDPSVVGSTFFVNTKPVTIAGIAPQGFYGDRLTSAPPDFYLPIESIQVLANAPYLHNPNVFWLYVIGRVKPGVNRVRLQDKLSALVKQTLAQTDTFKHPRGKALLPRAHVVLTPGGAGIEWLKSYYESNLHLLMWISALVLLIACANIANLLLARGMARKTEMSVRAALGAMRSRIVVQLLTESVVLALLSGVAGLVVAFAGTTLLLKMAFPGAKGLPIHAAPSIPVLAFAFALSLLTGVVFGLAPAWISAQTQPADALRSGSRTTAGGATVLQRGLVVLQAALALVLLVVAGLVSQSLGKLENSDLKLDSRNRYIVHINAQAAGYAQTQLDALYRTIEERFHAIPGVEKVGLSSYTPMEQNNWGTGILVQGQPNLDKGASFVKANTEYFDSVGTRVEMGRGIELRDTPVAPVVAVVNQTFVKTFIPKGISPIGQHFGTGGPDSPGDYEIVGVVEDTVYNAVQWKDHAMYFLPILQRPRSFTDPIEKDMSLYAGAMVIETSHPMSDMEPIARQTLAGINPNLTVVKFQTFDQQIADRFNDERMLARLTMLFGALALMLAVIGLYGVTAYTVARRTSEIGIRMALGAERSQVTLMVMRGALIQAALGLALGIPAAYACMRFVKAQLYEVTSIDPGVMLASILTLAVAACLAGLIPARRAASTDPARALRIE